MTGSPSAGSGSRLSQFRSGRVEKFEGPGLRKKAADKLRQQRGFMGKRWKGELVR